MSNRWWFILKSDVNPKRVPKKIEVRETSKKDITLVFILWALRAFDLIFF